MNNEKTESRLKDISPSRKELELEIPEAEVAKEREKILKDYAGRAKIAGFRKGHAPRDMVGKLFDGDIRHDVYDSLVPRILGEELKSLGLDPVNVPVIRDLKHEDGQPLRCTVAFEVLPGFDLPDYRTVKISEQETAVTDEEIGRALEDMRERASEFVPVEGRGVAAGDYVVAEIQGRDLKSKKLLPVEKAVILAGHADNEAALNEHLPGMKAGEERAFEVSYSQDHPVKRLAGKAIGYRLKVSEIKEKRSPGLDDDFARSLGDHRDLEDLKGKIRDGLRASKEKAGRSAMAREVLREIGRRLSLELPESLVAQEAQAVLRRMLGAARLNTRPEPEVLERLQAEARKQAHEHLTNHLILEKIAAQEGFDVSEEEFQEEIRSLAQANNVSAAALTDMINREDRRQELRESLLFRKTVDFLVKTAIIS